MIRVLAETRTLGRNTVLKKQEGKRKGSIARVASKTGLTKLATRTGLAAAAAAAAAAVIADSGSKTHQEWAGKRFRSHG